MPDCMLLASMTSPYTIKSRYFMFLILFFLYTKFLVPAYTAIENVPGVRKFRGTEENYSTKVVHCLCQYTTVTVTVSHVLGARSIVLRVMVHAVSMSLHFIIIIYYYYYK